MVLFSFPGRFIRFGKYWYLVFISDSFARKTTQQSDGSCNVTSDSRFYAKFSKKSIFISANSYKKQIVGKNIVLLATMIRCDFYPITDFKFFC